MATTTHSTAARGAVIKRIVAAYGDHLSYGQVMDIVANVLRWGGLAIGPSDCGYAVWALPTHPKAVRTLDIVLDHEATPIPLTFGSVPDMATLVRFGTIHLRLADAWPGGLTLVVPACGSKARKYAQTLHGIQTLGVRISRSVIERQIAAESGSAITSAAIRYPDGALVRTYEDAEAIVLDKVTACCAAGVLLVGVKHSGRFPLSVNSTVAALGDDGISIVRPGFYERRDLVAMASRIAVHEYADAT